MAASGRRRATFNDDLPRRIRFEREARRTGLKFEGGYRGRPRRLTYRVPILVPVYDDRRTLSITMPSSAVPGVIPTVLVDGPVCLRHRFPKSGGLCMWWHKDTVEKIWVPEDGLLALVGHAIDHAYCEARCQRGHPWPKPEAPTRHRDGCPTCRLRA
jgi:hypothetical protein